MTSDQTQRLGPHAISSKLEGGMGEVDRAGVTKLNPARPLSGLYAAIGND
jgi:hypothetical protein